MDPLLQSEKHSSLNLSDWDLPDAVLQNYHENGITSLFKWQLECLKLPGVLLGQNLVYSAPTSAGKTLVAELLLLKRVLEKKKKAIFIVPFVSMAKEKTHYLQRMFGSCGVVVEGFMGGQVPAGGLSNVDIAVCTIEKANNLCNRLMQAGSLGEVGVMVVDELHLVADGQRGYLLELLLTKLRFSSHKAERALSVESPTKQAASPHANAHRKENTSDNHPSSHPVAPSLTDSSNVFIQGLLNSTNSCHMASQHDSRAVQIIGMSATLPNLSLLADWLHAALYVTDHRPVPLTHLLLCEGTLLAHDMTVVRKLKPDPSIKNDPDQVLQLCVETLLEGFSVLVFCSSRARTETLAVAIAKHIFTLGSSNAGHPHQEEIRRSLDPAALMRVLQALQDCPAGLDKTLACSLQYGTAFHHAGLTTEERDIVEASYRSGIVRVLVATTTLSSGVNMPARRVLIRSPYFGAGRPLDPLAYHQMAGRAGRKGVDTQGECVLVCSSRKELEVGRAVVEAPLPEVSSCLARSAHSLSGALKRALLEVVVSGAATSVRDLKDYCRCTLLAACLRRRKTRSDEDGEELGSDVVHSCIKYLLDNEFICPPLCISNSLVITLPLLSPPPPCSRSEGELSSSPLGRAVLRSGLSPDEGLLVFAELHAARRCLVLDTDFHLIMLVSDTDFHLIMLVSDTDFHLIMLVSDTDFHLIMLVSDTDFHLIMLVTPIYISCSPDWMALLEVWEGLPEAVKRVASLLGIKESFIVQAVKGTVCIKVCGCQGHRLYQGVWLSRAPSVSRCVAVKGTVCTKLEQQALQLRLQKRFYTALALHDLLQEVPLPAVAAKYNINKGLLQSLQQSAATFAGMVKVFSKCLGWRSLALLVHEFESCLQFGVRPELHELVQLEHVSSTTARRLYTAGITTLHKLAKTSHRELVIVLEKSMPFLSRAHGDEFAASKKKRDAAAGAPEGGGQVWVEGVGWTSITREAYLILADARNHLMKQVGVSNVNWDEAVQASICGTPPLPTEALDSNSPVRALSSSQSGTTFTKTEDSRKVETSSVRELRKMKGHKPDLPIQDKTSPSQEQVNHPVQLDSDEALHKNTINNICHKKEIPRKHMVMNTINQNIIGTKSSQALPLNRNDVNDSFLLPASHANSSLMSKNKKDSRENNAGEQTTSLSSPKVCTPIADRDVRVSSTQFESEMRPLEKITRQSLSGTRSCPLNKTSDLKDATCHGSMKVSEGTQVSSNCKRLTLGSDVERVSPTDHDPFDEDCADGDENIKYSLNLARIKSDLDLFGDDECSFSYPPTSELYTPQKTGHSGTYRSPTRSLCETYNSIKTSENGVGICLEGKNSMAIISAEAEINVKSRLPSLRVSEVPIPTLGIPNCTMNVNSGAVDNPDYRAPVQSSQNTSETCDKNNLPPELEQSLLAMSLSPWTNTAPLVSTCDVRDQDDGHLSPDADCNVTFSCDIDDLLGINTQKSVSCGKINNTSVTKDDSVALDDQRWRKEMVVDDDDLFGEDNVAVKVTSLDDFNDSLDINSPNLYSQSTPAGFGVTRLRLNLSTDEQGKHEDLKRESMSRSGRVYEPQLDILSAENSNLGSLDESVLESLSDLHINTDYSKQNASNFSGEGNVLNSSCNYAREKACVGGTDDFANSYASGKKSLEVRKPIDLSSSSREKAKSKNTNYSQPSEDDIFDEFDMSDPNAMSAIQTPVPKSFYDVEKPAAVDSGHFVASESPTLKTGKQPFFHNSKIQHVTKTKRQPLIDANHCFLEEKVQAAANDHFVSTGKENVKIQSQNRPSTMRENKRNSLYRGKDRNSSSENEFSHLVSMEESFFADISDIVPLMNKTFKAFDDEGDVKNEGDASLVSPSSPSLTLNLSKDAMLESSQQDTSENSVLFSSQEISFKDCRASHNLNAEFNSELEHPASTTNDHRQSDCFKSNSRRSNIISSCANVDSKSIYPKSKGSDSATALKLESPCFRIKAPMTNDRRNPAPAMDEFNRKIRSYPSNQNSHKNVMKDPNSIEWLEDMTINVRDLSSDLQLLQEFLTELDAKENFSLVLIENKQYAEQKENSGGDKSDLEDGDANSTQGMIVEGRHLQRLLGVVIAYNDRAAHVLQLTDQAGLLDIKIRRDALRRIISADQQCKTRSKTRRGSVVLWESCATLCLLWRATGAMLSRPLKDICTATWMLGVQTSSLSDLVDQYIPQQAWLCRDTPSASREAAAGDVAWESRARSAARRAVATLLLLEPLEHRLHLQHMHQHWVMVEMPCAAIVAKLQLNGMGFCGDQFQQTVRCVQRLLSELEQDAHRACGRVFKLSSFGDLASVLYKTLRLPPPLDWRQRLSKGTLGALKKHHALPGIVLQWRKLHAALHKMLLPLERLALYNKRCGMRRVLPHCHRHTATGRVNMAEPSLQCVPRDISITTEPRRSGSSSKFTTPLMEQLLFNKVWPQCDGRVRCGFRRRTSEKPVETVVSCRRVIAARAGYVLLAADYCQLELRVLAHCSKDVRLKKLLSEDSEQDVFLRIAAEIFNTDGTSATAPPQRDQAKQLCYAVIYGMGSKTLAAQLDITEEEASQKRQKFLKIFPGISSFMKETLDRARSRGYISTIMGRRRLLDNIQSLDSALRSQSERQAVNSVIQGSAADVVKAAMVSVDAAITKRYPSQPCTLADVDPDVECNVTDPQAHLVLQLHDELMYEVWEEEMLSVAVLLKAGMERTTHLDVPLPVKLKAGHTWADMRDLQL
ncbi:DNA-directed DNA polymerase family A palm domain [Trinorchestia longiramus]|nr:DNA-directed DNA polymerase family A palm domain [Trinorchestia longiramus]